MSSKQKLKWSHWAEDVKNFDGLLAAGYNQTERESTDSKGKRPYCNQSGCCTYCDIKVELIAQF